MTAAETVATALGNASARGDDWHCDCPLCGRHTLALRDGNTRLLVKCFNGCSSKDVLSELRRSGRYKPTKGNGAAPDKPDTRARHEARAALAKAKRKARIDSALDIFHNSYPATDTMVEVYLASRLLLGPVPQALRFVPSLWHKEAGARYPAMVGLVEHVIDGAVGLHVVFLNPLDATVRVTIEPRKSSHGPIKGGAVRLAPAGPILALAEGIEDALAFMQATGTPTWAAISAIGVRNFVPPPLSITSTIILIEDNDANRTGQDAVADTARRLAKAGYEIKIARPRVGKDINDALLQLGLCEELFTLDDYRFIGATGDWYPKCIAGSDGRTLSNLSNTLLALREDPVWHDAFTHDELLAAALLYGKPISDEDVTMVREWLQLAGLPSVAESTTRAAIDLVAREHSFHPVKQYLESLTWDGVERLDDWLTDCCGVEKRAYAMAVGRMFLIAMVAQIYQPGCQADYMLILEGRQQGRQKSTACRILAGEWFSDNLPVNVASKDASGHLRGKWLIEMSDLHTFSASAIAALKAFITRRTDIYRPAYGHKEAYLPRQCLFIGTTNDEVYLGDPTGGRRFWPAETGEIEVATLTSQRDQLFAEAVVRFRRGERWWPDAEFEAEHIAPEQDARFNSDVWEEPIAEYLAARRKVTVYEIARNALFVTTDRIETRAQNRIMKVLQYLGWRRGPRGTAGVRWWERV